MKKHHIRITGLWLALIGVLLLPTAAFSAVFYVKPAGNDALSGASWTLAKKTVQAAINAANAGDEIWVAAGTYSEHIKNKITGPSGSEVAVDTALYGGFAGTETARDQRNWQTNLTILDGGDPPPSPTVNGSVIIIDSGATQATRIDGFVITRGHGIAAGGIFVSGSGPVIANNTITQNFSNVGGGVLISNYKVTPPQVHPTLTNNIIIYNYAIEAGGGIAVVGSERINVYDPVAPVISRNNISRNVSELHGGGIGIYGHAAPQIANNYIFANTAAYDEATFMGNGGGIYATSRDVDDAPLRMTVCAPVIVSNVIAANGANFGGGIHLWDTDVDHGGIPVVTNNTVVGNNGTGISWMTTYPIIQNNLVAYNSRGLEQGDSQSAPQVLRNNCVWGNELWEKNTNYSGLEDQAGINGNLSADPKMANYRIGEFHLQTGSQCIDAGYTAAIGNGWTDFDGQPRIIGNSVDIGADESDGTVGAAPTPIYYVRPTGNDAQNGLSWAAAKKTVSSAIALAQNTGGEIWVAAGTYTERNILPAFIYLYGGFTGTETDRASRNVSANPTILDGGSGLPTVVDSLYAGYFLSAIDGFTIQHGGLYTGGSVPSGTQGYKGRGGGIYCQVTSPFIRNNTIRHNSMGNPFDNANKTAYGGGIYTYLSYALIQDNTITENEILNTFDGKGGGIYFFRSMPTIVGNHITANKAKYGAAIYGYYSDPLILENSIENNAMYNTYPLPLYFGSVDGALTLDMGWDFTIDGNLIKGNTAAIGAGINVKSNTAGYIQNNLILNNTAFDPTANGGMGGGIYCLVNLGGTQHIINNTIWGNTASYALLPKEEGGGMAISVPESVSPPPATGQLFIANNILAFNSSGIFMPPSGVVPPTLTKNDIFNTGANYINLSPGASDISVNPGFVNSSSGDFHLLETSPCIDGGDNSSISAGLTHDYAGSIRIIDGNHNRAAIVDIGAYEYKALTDISGLFDYSGTAATDVSAFHSTTNQFFTELDGNLGQYGWGIAGDCYPLVWDYDENGATEVSIYHIPTNQWFVKGVPGDNLGQFGWGLDDSIPVPGDYNGDGVIERAFYHWPTNRWFIDGQDPIQFGWGGADCIPIAADYDGDGKTDMMLYHVPTNQWFVYGAGNLGQFGWNGSECMPVPGDWDGDGRTEIGIYHRPSNQWFWRNEDGATHFLGQYGWGGTQSFPIPGDYNGDGVMERAFYRPAENRWFIEGESAFVWGYGGPEFMPISSQMAIYNWFRFGLGRFQ
jgi:hypothetical protein